MTCSLQVNAPTHASPGNYGCVVHGVRGSGVTGAAEACAFNASASDNVYLCTSVRFGNGTVLYYDERGGPTREGAWSTRSESRCGLATTVAACDAAPCAEAPYEPTLSFVLHGVSVPLPPAPTT